MPYDNLFESIEVGPITLDNRIVRSAHATGLVGEGLIAYHEARAAGGVGMSTLEAMAVLYAAGGIARFYQGMSAALLQGPLSRFGDTASNAGMLALWDSFEFTKGLPVWTKTVSNLLMRIPEMCSSVCKVRSRE